MLHEDQTLIFTHIHKSAGTTLDRIFQAVADGTGRLRGRAMGSYLGQFPVRDERDAIEDLRAKVANAKHLANIQYLCGHLPYGAHESLPGKCDYMVLLRDPAERGLSHFRMGVMREAWETDTDPAALVENGRMLDNAQVRQVAGAMDANEPCDEVTLDTAVRNLDEHYLLAATTEDFDLTLSQLIAMGGWPNIVYGNYQRSTIDLPPERESTLQEIFERRNPLDRALYEYVRQNPKPAPVKTPVPRTPRDVLLVSPDLRYLEQDSYIFSQAQFSEFESQFPSVGVEIGYPQGRP